MALRNTTRQIIDALESHGVGPVFAGQPTTANSVSSMRNHAFILSALTTVFANTRKVFEVGSGTGHHACIFASELTHLTWQPSDAIEPYKDKINTTLDQVGRPQNILPPKQFDAATDELPQDCDAVYMANVLHCMSRENAEKLITKAGMALLMHGLLVTYGPFNIVRDRFDTGLNDGKGNHAFDVRLKQENPSFGIRNLDDICLYAKNVGMTLTQCLWHEAANNYLLVFQKTSITIEHHSDLLNELDAAPQIKNESQSFYRK